MTVAAAPVGDGAAHTGLQLFCISSVDSESWYATWRRPHDRAEWQDRYDRRDDRLRGSSEYLSGVLWTKQIGNALRIWDGWAHDWPWSGQMIAKYIGGHD